VSVTWQAPPPVKHKGGARAKWVPRLLPLMEQPGEWAVFPAKSGDTAATTASHLKRGRLTAPAGRWEFTGRTTDDGKGAVYARYLGPVE
jgi:hypothetical protein